MSQERRRVDALIERKAESRYMEGGGEALPEHLSSLRLSESEALRGRSEKFSFCGKVLVVKQQREHRRCCPNNALFSSQPGLPSNTCLPTDPASSPRTPSEAEAKGEKEPSSCVVVFSPSLPPSFPIRQLPHRLPPLPTLLLAPPPDHLLYVFHPLSHLPSFLSSRLGEDRRELLTNRFVCSVNHSTSV